jgi:hypothetical protein
VTLAINHSTVMTGTDDPSYQINPTQWNAGLVATMATARLLGRTTASAGSVEELAVGAGLGLASQVLFTPNYDTRAALALANVPAALAYVTTAGFSAAGDGGHCRYVRVSATNPGGVQSADGQWWRPVFEGPVIPEVFGAKGDGTTDDIAALQASSDYFVGNNNPSGTIFLSRSYAISDTWTIQKKGVILLGTGWGSGVNPSYASALRWIGTTAGKPMLLLLNTAGAGVENLRFTSIGNVTCSAALEVRSDTGVAGVSKYTVLRRLWIGDLIGYDSTITGSQMLFTNGLLFSGDVDSDSNIIDYLSIWGGGTGIYMANPNTGNTEFTSTTIFGAGIGVRIKGGLSHFGVLQITGSTTTDIQLDLGGRMTVDAFTSEGSKRMLLIAGTDARFVMLHGVWQCGSPTDPSGGIASDGLFVNTQNFGNFVIDMRNFSLQIQQDLGSTVPKMRAHNTDGGTTVGRLILDNVWGMSLSNVDIGTPVWSNDQIHFDFNPAPQAGNSSYPRQQMILNYDNVADRDVEYFRNDFAGKVNVYGGGFNVRRLTNARNAAAFTGFAVATGTGSTTYSYRVTAVTADGETDPTAALTCTNAATLNATTNYNTLSWHTIIGAKAYRVYGRTSGSEQLLHELPWNEAFGGPQWVDKGTLTPSGALPTRNTTGSARIEGPLSLPNAGGSTGYLTPMTMGIYALWVDGSGGLRIKSSLPTSDTDGALVSAGGGTVTNETIDDRVAALLVAGTNVTLTYDDTANTLTIAASGSVSNEQIDDRVAALLVAGTGITHTYDDTANTLTTAFSTTFGDGRYALASHTHVAANVSDFAEAVDDRVGALLVAGANVTLTYNDASNTLTIAASGTGGGGSPGGSSGQFQTNNAGAFAGSNLIVIDANTLAIRNGTSAQELRISGTYTDDSNYERGYSRFVSGDFTIGTEKAGTGVARGLVLSPASGLTTALGRIKSIQNTNTDYVLSETSAMLIFENTDPAAQIICAFKGASGIIGGYRCGFDGSLNWHAKAGGQGHQFWHSVDASSGIANLSSSGLQIGGTPGAASAYKLDIFGSSRIRGNAYFDGIVEIDSYIQWTASGPYLSVTATNTLGLSSGTAACALQVFNTTDGTNLERGVFRFVSNVLQIGAEQGGTGVVRDMAIVGSKLTTLAVTATKAGLNVAPGTVPPTTPVNGDLWETANGIFAYINGATKILDAIQHTTLTADATGTNVATAQPVFPTNGTFTAEAGCHICFRGTLLYYSCSRRDIAYDWSSIRRNRNIYER